MLTFSNYSYPYVSNNLSGVSNIIQGLPDNKNNLITPQNLRDAIYTTWINNVFKQTTASGSYYIGLDSDPASNILTNPFYFGKRNYLGSNIMNPTLLNNGTDVFFFNNKSDSVTQSTIVTFLAGDPSLFNNAPYIITAATNSGLDISVINPNGNVNLLSASNSNIYLNGYQFPSINATGSVGQALILDSNNVLTWQNVSNNFTYNNPNTSTIAVGGVPSGISFSNISVTDLFNKMFYPNIAPIMLAFTITYTGISDVKTSSNFYQLSSVVSGNPIEIGSLTGSITYSVTIQPKSLPVNYATFSGSGTDGGYIQSQVISGITQILALTGNVSPVPNPNTTTYTYNVYVEDTSGAISGVLSTNILSYYPYYYVVSSTPYTLTQIINDISFGNFLNKVILYNANGTNYVASGTINVPVPNGGLNGYLYFAVPTIYAKTKWANADTSFPTDSGNIGGIGSIGSFVLGTSSVSITTQNWTQNYNIYYTPAYVIDASITKGYNFS